MSMKKSLLASILIASTCGFTQMTTQGNATQMGGCDCYQITANAAAQVGAIWSVDPIDLTEGFDMTFDVYLGAEDVWGADGLAFVLQQNPFGIGDVGRWLGYGDEAPLNPVPVSAASVAIEIDTYDSGSSVPTDIGNDHLGIHSNGSVDHNLAAPVVLPEMEDGAYHTFRVVWNPTINTLYAYEGTGGVPDISYTGNIINTIFGGNPIVYWGWTGATGGLYNEQRVCASSTANYSADLSTICPGSTVNFTESTTTDIGLGESWSWDFGDGSPLDNSQNPSHTFNSPGVYTVEMTYHDGWNCPIVVSSDITVLDSLILDMSVFTDAICFEDSTGTATATPTNGSGTYTWSWDDYSGQTSETANNLPAGVYTATVTDNMGCVGIDSVTISEPASAISANGVGLPDNGTNSGSIDLTVSGGQPGYTFDWTGPNSYTANTEDISGLEAGLYTVTITDAGGCQVMLTVDIKSSVGIEDNGLTELNLFPNPSTGQFTIDVNGTFQYSITDASGKLILTDMGTDITTVDLSLHESGIYFVTVVIDHQTYIQKLLIQ